MASIKKTVSTLLLSGGVAIVLSTVGCGDSGCLDNKSAIPLAKFYSSQNKEEVSISTLRVAGIGAPGDSVLLEAGIPTSKVYLPMRSSNTETSWCFSYTQSEISAPEFNDTLTFRYISEPIFVSSECGAMYYYRITTLENTTHLIDSVVIVDSLITNFELERIKIYFKADEQTPSEAPKADI